MNTADIMNLDTTTPGGIAAARAAIVADFRNRAAIIDGIGKKPGARELVIDRWVLKSSDSLYLVRTGVGYEVASVLSAGLWREESAHELAHELRDKAQPDWRAVPVRYMDALAHEAAELRRLADGLEQAAQEISSKV